MKPYVGEKCSPQGACTIRGWIYDDDVCIAVKEYGFRDRSRPIAVRVYSKCLDEWVELLTDQSPLSEFNRAQFGDPTGIMPAFLWVYDGLSPFCYNDAVSNCHLLDGLGSEDKSFFIFQWVAIANEMLRRFLTYDAERFTAERRAIMTANNKTAGALKKWAGEKLT